VAWLKNTLKKDGAEITNQPVYQVLKLDTDEGHLYFWRANKDADWFHMHTNEEQVAERNATRAARASWFGAKQGKGSSQCGRAPGQWGPDPAEEEGTGRYPQGSKGSHNWGQASREDQEGSQYRYPQGAKDPWVKAAQEPPQEAMGREAADMWTEYNTNKGNATGGQYRDFQRDDTPYDFRGWRKGWHQG